MSAEFEDSTLFTDLCNIDWWERSYTWPAVVDFDEWPGDVG